MHLSLRPKALIFHVFIVIVATTHIVGCQQKPGVTPKGATSAKTSKPKNFGESTKQKTSYAQFPDIPFPSGATINSEKTTIVGSRPWYGLLSLTSLSSPGLMFEFFDSKMESYRWQKIASVRAKTSILTFMKDNRVLTISVQERPLTGSEVSITSSPINKSEVTPRTPNGRPDIMPVPAQKIN